MLANRLEQLSKELRTTNSTRDLKLPQLTSLLRQCVSEISLATVPFERIPALHDKLLGELVALLVSDLPMDPKLLTLLTCLIRLLAAEGKVPRFINKDLGIYSPVRLLHLLRLVKELDSDGGVKNYAGNLSLIASILGNPKHPVGLRLEAFSVFVHFAAEIHANECAQLVDASVCRVLNETKLVDVGQISASGGNGNFISNFLHKRAAGSSVSGISVPEFLELDNSISNEHQFSVVLHAKSFSTEQLLHCGIFSNLSEYVKLRVSKKFSDESGLITPPGSPTDQGPNVSFSSRHNLSFNSSVSVVQDSSLKRLMEQVVAFCVRTLNQCLRDVSPLILENRKNFKYVPDSFGATTAGSTNGYPPPLLTWTRSVVETIIVEVVKILNIICVRDPSRVSHVFPHVRRVYDRVVVRQDSPGVAVCEVISFMLNHSHLVIYDVDPVLRFFFASHIPKLTNANSKNAYGDRKTVLAAEAVNFLVQTTPLLCVAHLVIFLRFFPSLFQLVAWYPRLAGAALVPVFQQLVQAASAVPSTERGKSDSRSLWLVNLFHSILDLPMFSAVMEMSLDISDYIDHAGVSSGSTGGGSNSSLIGSLIGVAMGGHDGATQNGGGNAASVPSVSSDPFANARQFMRLMRSSQFRDICDYVNRTDEETADNVWMVTSGTSCTISLLKELWNGLTVTPRVAATSRLVPVYLKILLDEMALRDAKRISFVSSVLSSVLVRFGNIFLFKQATSDLLIRFISSVIFEDLLIFHKSEIVTAILESRVWDDPEDPLVLHLMFLIGEVPSTIEKSSAGLPLFIRTLRTVLVALTGGDSETSQRLLKISENSSVVCVKSGRLVESASDAHPLLNREVRTNIFCAPNAATQQLQCVVISALTKLACKFPQYRPQTRELLELVDTSGFANERVQESLRLLRANHFDREYLARGS